MSTIIDKAIFAVPEYGNRISLFILKLRLAQYSESTITNYCHHVSKAVVYLKRIPDHFTQADVDDYLSMLLNHPMHYSVSYFKHTVFGLKDYYRYLDLPEPKGLVLPDVRKNRRLPKVLSQEQVARLIRPCGLYAKTLLSIIYDCGLRASEACSLRWEDINFDRHMLLVVLGKGRKDRYVPISGQMVRLLEIFRKRYPQ